MSPVALWNGIDWLDRFGHPVPRGTPIAPFVLGQTFPTLDTYAGPDPALGDPEPYTGPNAGGTLTISSPTTFEGVDFTGTMVVLNSSDVEFRHCKAVNVRRAVYNETDPGPMFNCRTGTSYGGRYFYRCAFDNAHQYAPMMNAVIGYGYTLERCTAKNMQDMCNIYVPDTRPDSACDVAILGCHVDELAFWWAPSGGIVHPSDTIDHCDCIQWQGGTGLRVEGNFLGSRYSPTIGTGTPNSGNNTPGLGASGVPYTQAAGVAKRFEIVEGNGLYSAGQPGAFLGGSLSGLMLSPSARGHLLNGLVVKNNWGTGGAFWVNGGNSTLTGTVEEISGNRVDNNQRIPGRAVVIKSGLPITNYGIPPNVWTDGSGTIPRRTG